MMNILVFDCANVNIVSATHPTYGASARALSFFLSFFFWGGGLLRCIACQHEAVASVLNSVLNR